ncbi:colicin D domain-containing protein [Mucilaginibacter flavus]|uniref:colicin D domain-containing protein n=1 Tax=Mucilaginibacter flavus TaxID=931504 RepID=UPI0025B45F5E|nr:colicin D domain-containing protein [Mucilaginibacter flavus]MDN3584376.1 colicin D domain-containing protein [Mucilaginibacter flavus]
MSTESYMEEHGITDDDLTTVYSASSSNKDVVKLGDGSTFVDKTVNSQAEITKKYGAGAKDVSGQTWTIGRDGVFVKFGKNSWDYINPITDSWKGWNEAFQKGIKSWSPMLNTAKYTAIGTTGVIGGGLVGGESAGNFLIDRGDRLADFFEGMTSSTPESSSVLNFTSKSLQAKFKRAGDFGIEENWSRAAAGRFSAAINQHINDIGTQVFQGAYRNSNNLVNFYLNPQTGLNVIATPSGKFISGWLLEAPQIQSVITRGFLW